jgi:hypothetical protein
MDTITITGGGNKIKDPSGNIAANFSAQAVTNNIGVPILVDTFTRADSASSIGSLETPVTPWIVAIGTWGISSNKGYCASAVNTGAVTGNRIYADCGVVDYTYEVDCYVGSAGTTLDVLFRYVDANNYWAAEIDVVAMRIKLYKRIAGSTTIISSPGIAFTFVPTTTYRIKIITSGNSISVYVDNVLKTSTSDAALGTSTKVGLSVYSGTGLSNNADRFDNLQLV